MEETILTPNEEVERHIPNRNILITFYYITIGKNQACLYIILF